MLEQLRYDMITGLFHHKKRALLVIISVLLTYVFMCFSYRGLINTADFISYYSVVCLILLMKRDL